MTSIAGIAFVGFPNAEDGENAIQQEVVSGSSLEPVRIDNEGAGLAAVWRQETPCTNCGQFREAWFTAATI